MGRIRLRAAMALAATATLQHRVATGRWDDVATPGHLEETAVGLGLGDAAFIRYLPATLSGDNGPFDPHVGPVGG